MTKQLFIVYDKDWSQSATLLYNLLSSNPDIRASLYTKKEINKLVSREKCLFIGKDCSSSLNFDDNYNKIGIHVGYMGAKAWIRCSEYEWNNNSFNEFEYMLKTYTDKYKTKKEYEKYKNKDKVYIRRQFQCGDEPWPGNPMERIKDKNIANSGISRASDYFVAVANQVYAGGLMSKMLSKVLGQESIIREYQYLIGIYKFYEDYLNEFLGISESGDNSNNEEAILESEKKK